MQLAGAMLVASCEQVAGLLLLVGRVLPEWRVAKPSSCSSPKAGLVGKELRRLRCTYHWAFVTNNSSRVPMILYGRDSEEIGSH